MGRLWTYQEGFLPPWVDLELSDSLYNLDKLLQHLYKLWRGKSTESLVLMILTRDLLTSL